MRFAYTDISKENHDLIQLTADGLDIRLYFEPQSMPYFDTVISMLQKFTLKNSLLKEFKMKSALGKGGFATVTFDANIRSIKLKK